MTLISCYRIRFKIPTEKTAFILNLIEEASCPDAVATGEIAEGKAPQKGLEAVELLYQEKPDTHILFNIFTDNNITPTEYMMDILSNEDWVTASLRELPAVTSGRFMVHGSHCRPIYKPACFTLEIDAGLAFGTGHHETTAGCLAALTYLSKFYTPQTIADIGTGTGVLAMAAVKLWRKNVIATDIDSIAVRVTKNNVIKNNMHPYITSKTVSGVNAPIVQKNAPYDLLIANILARPLMGMSGSFAKVIKKQGYIILSGLLWRQVAMVSYAYKSHGFILHKAFQFGEWASLILQKKKNQAYNLPKESE